jgi:hypothetical protein
MGTICHKNATNFFNYASGANGLTRGGISPTFFTVLGIQCVRILTDSAQKTGLMFNVFVH